jgi:RNA polymerase sigma factor (sigma-70 family)
VAEHPSNTDTHAFRGAIRARDHAAWATLTAECYPLLLRYAVRNLPPQADAESVVQEALYRAFRKARRYDPLRAAFPWLAGFCMNECLRQRRSIARHRVTKSDWYAVHEGESRPVVHEREARTSVVAALEALPRRQHEVLNLRFGFRLSCQEISEVLGISPKAAQVALTRGLLRLRTSSRSQDLREWLSCLEGGRIER